MSLHYLIGLFFFLNCGWQFSIMAASKLHNLKASLHLYLGKGEKKTLPEWKPGKLTQPFVLCKPGLLHTDAMCVCSAAAPHAPTPPCGQSACSSDTVPGVLWLWTIWLCTRFLYLQKQRSVSYSHLKHNFLAHSSPTLQCLKWIQAQLTVISIKLPAFYSSSMQY